MVNVARPRRSGGEPHDDLDDPALGAHAIDKTKFPTPALGRVVPHRFTEVGGTHARPRGPFPGRAPKLRASLTTSMATRSCTTLIVCPWRAACTLRTSSELLR